MTLIDFPKAIIHFMGVNRSPATNVDRKDAEALHAMMVQK